MAQLWKRLGADDEPDGFPKQSPALAVVHVKDQEFVVAVGGSSLEEQLAHHDIDEMCCQTEAPVDVWARLSGRAPNNNASRSTAQDLATARPFDKSVLAFPPKPRSGFSLTPLDTDGRRLLLFGGRSGRQGGRRHFLADLHVLEFAADTRCQVGSRALMPSASSSDSEPEEIFYASDYHMVCGASSKSPQAVPSVGERNRRNPRDRDAHNVSQSSSDDESSIGVGNSRPSTGMRGATQPRTFNDVMSRLGSDPKVDMSHRKPQQASSSVTQTGCFNNGEARWRQPQAQDGETLRPRICHSAVLQRIGSQGELTSVIIFGGLGEGGIPLGDTYELLISESQDKSLESRWRCLVDAGSGGCEIAPWEQQDMPRPRACHSAVISHSVTAGCMVVFGGLGLGQEGEPRAYGDTWLLMNKSSRSVNGAVGNREAAFMWKRPMMQGGAPARRWGHGACIVGGMIGAGAKMLLCGGCEISGSALSDCWILYLDEMRWESMETALPMQPVLWPPSRSSRSEPEIGTPRELGRCTLIWSSLHDTAIVCGAEGLLLWQEPEQACWTRTPRRCSSESASPDALHRSKKGKHPKLIECSNRNSIQPKVEDVVGADAQAGGGVRGWSNQETEREWVEDRKIDFARGKSGKLMVMSAVVSSDMPDDMLGVSRPPGELPSVQPPPRRRPPRPDAVGGAWAQMKGEIPGTPTRSSGQAVDLGPRALRRQSSRQELTPLEGPRTPSQRARHQHRNVFGSEMNVRLPRTL